MLEEFHAKMGRIGREDDSAYDFLARTSVTTIASIHTMWFQLLVSISIAHNILHQISRLATVTVTFHVKRRSPTLFPVLPKPEVVFDG